MRMVVNGQAFLTFGQIYVESGDKHADFDDSFRGQQNGLCGAAIPGTLCLLTGLHTGHVGLVVEVHDEEPTLDDSWEDIVEASFRPVGDTTLAGLDSSDWWKLGLDPIDYRVRYGGRAIDAGHQSERERERDDHPVDHYLLQFWPAPPQPDQVLKVTSTLAQNLHDRTRRMRPPPTAEEIAAANARREEQQRAKELEKWGGSLPSGRIRQAENALDLVPLDRPLLDDLDHLDDETLVAIARWAARLTCAITGLHRIEWIAEALDRMDQGVDPRDVVHIPPEMLAAMPLGGRESRQPQPEHALMAIDATYAEPLDAALTTLWMAIRAYGVWRGAEVTAKVRSVFPQLGQPDGARPQR